MKLRVADRILVFTAGLLLLACCAGIICQLFLGVDLIAIAERMFTNDSVQIRTLLIGIAVVLLLLGCYCVLVLFRHRRRRDRFVLQKNENGDLAISIKALENMVQKCLNLHGEITAHKLQLESKKDGLLIKITGDVAGGISIPLTVESLQKQIRQYVTACSGIEIKGVTVRIEGSGEDDPEAPFAIAAPSSRPLLREPEERQTVPVHNADYSAETSADLAAEPAEEQEQEKTQAQISAAVNTTVPEPEDQDDRPLHQRLFSTQPEPCIVPEPPTSQENIEPDQVNHEPESVNSPETPEQHENGADVPKNDVPCDSDDNPSELPEGIESVEECTLATDETADSHPADDSDFLESLKAFDCAVTGEKTEETVYE